jgi:hypothetical protein
MASRSIEMDEARSIAEVLIWMKPEVLLKSGE